ncbi:MAG: D-alanyl-D-alanine carboxypeptidase family protein [Eubacteriaceae bacterium]|jgi:D-alanyl-D-alanine carboxypeptidase (penicillin-binding protein 5/6)
MSVRKTGRTAGVFLCICILMMSCITSVHAAFPTFDSSEGIVVMETQSGDVLASQNENDQFYPASTTKLMTALVMMDQVGDSLDTTITVGDEVSQFGYESSTAGLEAGQSLSYKDLLYAMLLPSGNDAAETIAVNIGKKLMGSDKAKTASWQDAVSAFVEEMNNKAKELGMTGTHFANPHGLYADDHYSTPSDFAKLGAAAFANDDIKTAASTKKYTIKNLDGTDNELKSTNLFLFENAGDYGEQIQEGSDDNPYYDEDMTAAKTGATDEGGRTFVYYSEKNGKKVIGVIFKSSGNDIFTQSEAAVKEVIDNYTLKSWTNGSSKYGDIQVENIHFTDGDVITLDAGQEVFSTAEDSVVGSLTAKVKWDTEYVTENGKTPKLLKKIEQGDQVAQLQILDGSTIVKEVPLYASNSVSPKNWTDFFVDNAFWIILGIALIAWFTIYRRNKKRAAARRRGRLR